MNDLLIKGLYLLVGLVFGYGIRSLMPGALESTIYKSIYAGQRVVISLGERAVLYEMVEGKLEVKHGILETKHIVDDIME